MCANERPALLGCGPPAEFFSYFLREADSAPEATVRSRDKQQKKPPRSKQCPAVEAGRGAGALRAGDCGMARGASIEAGAPLSQRETKKGPRMPSFMSRLWLCDLTFSSKRRKGRWSVLRRPVATAWRSAGRERRSASSGREAARTRERSSPGPHSSCSVCTASKVTQVTS